MIVILENRKKYYQANGNPVNVEDQDIQTLISEDLGDKTDRNYDDDDKEEEDVSDFDTHLKEIFSIYY